MQRKERKGSKRSEYLAFKYVLMWCVSPLTTVWPHSEEALTRNWFKFTEIQEWEEQSLCIQERAVFVCFDLDLYIWKWVNPRGYWSPQPGLPLVFSESKQTFSFSLPQKSERNRAEGKVSTGSTITESWLLNTINGCKEKSKRQDWTTKPF